MSDAGSDPVETFVECARSYCELIESVDVIGRGELVWGTGSRLARLYAAGLELVGEPTDAKLVDSEVTDAEEERRSTLQSRLALHLDGVDDYWFIFDPYDVEDPDPDVMAKYVPAEVLERLGDRLTPEGVPEPNCYPLSDDLMSVYGGVKDGLSLYERGERASAIWEWTFGLGNGWGIYAVRALPAIHWLTHASGARHV